MYILDFPTILDYQAGDCGAGKKGRPVASGAHALKFKLAYQRPFCIILVIFLSILFII